MESIKTYLKEVRHIPLLKPEDELELAKLVRKGDKKARRKMIRSNLRIVINVAKRYIHLGLPLIDLIEEGNVGLMRAVDKFNPRRGFRFSTYAVWWIRQAIGRAISEQGRLIRVPIHISDILARMRKTNEALTQKFGRLPTTAELARTMGVSLQRLRQLTTWISKISSIDAPIGEDGDDQIKDLIEDTLNESPDVGLSKVLDTERMTGLLGYMNEQERKVLEMRFGLSGRKEHTLAEVGEKINVSRERVRQVEKSALKKLRKLAAFQDYVK